MSLSKQIEIESQLAHQIEYEYGDYVEEDRPEQEWPSEQECSDDERN